MIVERGKTLTFKLGYSTYALKMLDPFKAIQLIREVGYEALEICLSNGWPTSPLCFPPVKQTTLQKLCEDLGFPSPIFFGNIDICAPSHVRKAMIDLTLKKFEMVNRLHFDNSPIMLSTTLGPSAPPWASGKEQIKDDCLSLAEMAAEHNVVLGIEAHAGTDFEAPEKVIWVMEQSGHTNLKIDLDISHFFIEGNDVVRTVNLCAPYAVMLHIKDGEKSNGNIRYCLTGNGNINVSRFLNSLRLNGLEHMPVFAEVSVQQSSLSDYDPKFAAEFCFNSLDKARKEIELTPEFPSPKTSSHA